MTMTFRRGILGPSFYRVGPKVPCCRSRKGLLLQALRLNQHPVSVARGVGVEPDQFTMIVQAVDDRRADAVWIVDARPLRVHERVRDQKSVHDAAAVVVASDHLILIVEAERLRIASAWKRQCGEALTLSEEAAAPRARRDDTGDVARVVDRGRLDAAAAWRCHRRELAGGLIQRKAMVDAIRVGVEANRDAGVIQTEDLIYGTAMRLRVGVAGEDALPLDEPAVHVVSVDPKAGRIAAIVDRGYLRLNRSGVVFVLVIVLAVGFYQRVSLVRMGGENAATEIAGNFAVVVDS